MDTIIKTYTSKKGNVVIFRYPKHEDFEKIWVYACDLANEDTFVALSQAPTREEEKKWFSEMMQQVEANKSIQILAFINGQLVGSGRVNVGSGRHMHVGNLGISIVKDYRDEGIGKELMKSLIDQSRKLGLRLLTLSCFANNDKAIALYEKLGFKKAGIIPGEVFYKNNYIDSVQMYLPLSI